MLQFLPIMKLHDQINYQSWRDIHLKIKPWPVTRIVEVYIPKMLGKAKSATQSVLTDINTEWVLPEIFLGFLLCPWKFQTKQGFNPTPNNCVTLFRNFKALNQDLKKFYIILSWSCPENLTLFSNNPWKIHLLFLQYAWKFHILNLPRLLFFH